MPCFASLTLLISFTLSLKYNVSLSTQAMSIKPEEIALRKADFYESSGIELKLGQQV